MVTPRNTTFTGESITRQSLLLRDPADIFDIEGRDPCEMMAALGEAIQRIIDARPEWHDEAACRGSSIDFTIRGDARPALAVCGRCNVMDECRQWADELGDVVAVLGGEDVAARRLRWKQTGYVPPTSQAGPT